MIVERGVTETLRAKITIDPRWCPTTAGRFVASDSRNDDMKLLGPLVPDDLAPRQFLAELSDFRFQFGVTLPRTTTTAPLPNEPLAIFQHRGRVANGNRGAAALIGRRGKIAKESERSRKHEHAFEPGNPLTKSPGVAASRSSASAAKSRSSSVRFLIT